jgi:hypothetical protein
MDERMEKMEKSTLLSPEVEFSSSITHYMPTSVLSIASTPVQKHK